MCDVKQMKRVLACCFFLFVVLVVGFKDARAEFDVNWGISADNGLTGQRQLAQWLVGNGYYSDLSTAEFFAKTGYIGHNSGDPDPYYWNLSSPFNVQIVQEMAGYADFNKLGYYTGSGDAKIQTQIFGGTENGPKLLSINQPFGFYIETPKEKFWYTDRAENDQQHGQLRHFEKGGYPQALIYELKPDTEWLIAWEDLDATKRKMDRDYNDMYVKVTCAPEPVSCVLYLLGGGALATRLRKIRS